jgi:hypothetical protein
LVFSALSANLQRKVAWKRTSSLSHSGNRNSEIPAETLKQKTILLKLIDVGLNRFLSVERNSISLRKEQIMLEQNTSNRVLNRMGARELSPEEVQHVAGGTTGCHGTSLHKNGPILDVACDPA